MVGREGASCPNKSDIKTTAVPSRTYVYIPLTKHEYVVHAYAFTVSLAAKCLSRAVLYIFGHQQQSELAITYITTGTLAHTLHACN